MPKVKSIERKIANTEGFEVAILLADGRDVRSDKDGLPTYPYQNAAPNNFTICNGGISDSSKHTQDTTFEYGSPMRPRLTVLRNSERYAIHTLRSDGRIGSVRREEPSGAARCWGVKSRRGE